MNDTRQPRGIPSGGQFAHTAHGHPAVGLRGGLHVDKEAATYFSDQVDSIQHEGLTGALSAHDGKLKFTSNDGRAFEIHQDGHTDEDGNPGWAIDNHDSEDPSAPTYGMRYESRTDNLGEDLAQALAEADAIDAFTLNAGSQRYDFRSYDLIEGEIAISAACFADIEESGTDLAVFFDHDAGTLNVSRNGEELTGPDADDAVRDLVDSVDDDGPDGSPTGKLAWHMERSFRIAAAKHDSPDWTHKYRTEGLTWEDRNEYR
jgi:hypothetical protein